MTDIVEEHSPFGPSAAYRWMQCPASIMLSKQMPEEEETEFQAEGTKAHELAERILLGEMVDINEYGKEMYNYVREYTDYVQKKTEGLELLVEQKISLDNIDSRLFGTTDALAYDPSEGVLFVFDLKYGKGVEVQVEDNPQLKYYALCGMESCPAREVELTIVQPRISGQTIKTIRYKAAELMIFAGELEDAVHAVDTTPERTIPGTKQCSWCRASAICPAQSKSFQAITSVQPKNDEIALPETDTMGPESIGNIIKHSKQLRKWLDSVEAHAKDLMMQGEDIPHVKLVQQRKNRVIKNAAAAKKVMQKRGYLVRDICTAKLKSPAQLENAGVPKSLVEELSITPKGQLVLALETDKRLAEKVNQELDFEPAEGEKQDGN